MLLLLHEVVLHGGELVESRRLLQQLVLVLLLLLLLLLVLLRCSCNGQLCCDHALLRGGERVGAEHVGDAWKTIFDSI